jgi:hypothetical protein
VSQLSDTIYTDTKQSFNRTQRLIDSIRIGESVYIYLRVQLKIALLSGWCGSMPYNTISSMARLEPWRAKPMID